MAHAAGTVATEPGRQGGRLSQAPASRVSAGRLDSAAAGAQHCVGEPGCQITTVSNQQAAASARGAAPDHRERRAGDGERAGGKRECVARHLLHPAALAGEDRLFVCCGLCAVHA